MALKLARYTQIDAAQRYIEADRYTSKVIANKLPKMH